jgi:hypothetical protein
MTRISEPTSEQKKAYAAGADAFNEKGAEVKNPNPEGTAAAKYWEHGFLDAQKASLHGR